MARGIHVSGIAHVINYDVPNCPEDYVHRIGRTARAEASGRASTLVTPEERQQLRAIERLLGRPVPVAAS
jgi:ATP-dependent RNA helicase RhlE